MKNKKLFFNLKEILKIKKCFKKNIHTQKKYTNKNIKNIF